MIHILRLIGARGALRLPGESGVRLAPIAMIVVFLFVSLSAFGQIFPDQERLDVIEVTDGSILVGRIIDDVPDRYVEIELYGGSTFVIAYENIADRRQRRNPDYGSTWIKVEIGEGASGATTGGDTGPAANGTGAGSDDATATDVSGAANEIDRWIFPVGVGYFSYDGGQPFVELGAARRIGTNWYGGLNAHYFIPDIAIPLFTAAYTAGPNRPLYMLDFIGVPAGLLGGNPFFSIVEFGVAFNGFSLNAMALIDPDQFSPGFSVGFVF